MLKWVRNRSKYTYLMNIQKARNNHNILSIEVYVYGTRNIFSGLQDCNNFTQLTDLAAYEPNTAFNRKFVELLLCTRYMILVELCTGSTAANWKLHWVVNKETDLEYGTFYVFTIMSFKLRFHNKNT